MKVLFLDFDGVLNNFKTHLNDDGEMFCPKACANLARIMECVPDLKIVVSSSWRIAGLENVRRILRKNGINASRVIDITGDENGTRGYQIACWLARNPGVTKFVILDDERDMEPFMDRLVKTASYKGLVTEDIDEVVRKFIL